MRWLLLLPLLLMACSDHFQQWREVDSPKPGYQCFKELTRTGYLRSRQAAVCFPLEETR